MKISRGSLRGEAMIANIANSLDLVATFELSILRKFQHTHIGSLLLKENSLTCVKMKYFEALDELRTITEIILSSLSNREKLETIDLELKIENETHQFLHLSPSKIDYFRASISVFKFSEGVVSINFTKF